MQQKIKKIINSLKINYFVAITFSSNMINDLQIN